jgi:hypothetical protein
MAAGEDMKTTAPPPAGFGLIAPCGVDCALCGGFIRIKDRCPGCAGPDDGAKTAHCRSCSIRACAALVGAGEAPLAVGDKARSARGSALATAAAAAGRDAALCAACRKFPCARFRSLDKRYRTKYGEDLAANLRAHAAAPAAFAAAQAALWSCPRCSGRLCAHRPDCPACGAANPRWPAAPGETLDDKLSAAGTAAAILESGASGYA